MRGGLERWKRGVGSQGVRQAVEYAFHGACDSHLTGVSGAAALAHYSDVDAGEVSRFVVVDGEISVDQLDRAGLARWVNGDDPETGERRGRELASADADLVLDGTINAPKSYSLVALLNPELAAEFEALQDRLRERILLTWQRELNARRGAGGRFREQLHRIEVVELQHRRSRALDPHLHRHLWLSVKVLGQDGKWSNVDSRVAMKLHTVVNAEGELAARTDPQWVAALARHGYTIGADGEISQLVAAVRPLSRRSNQIEANKAVKLAEWQAANPGQEADRTVLQAIDRWAWAQGRPNKPGQVDEDSWGQMVAEEIAAIDSRLVRPRAAVAVEAVAVADLDRDLLAAKAVAEADKRSAATGGRFSVYDLRAGATRAVAASGVVADRVVLGEVIEDVTARAVGGAVNLLATDEDVPPHIKGYIAAGTVAVKVALAEQFDRLNVPGVTVPVDVIDDLAGQVLADGQSLDEGQTAAAAAIAGTDRLVTVTGPAGTGKTTMLRVARRALEGQGRRLFVVAPTKKAASVAGREVGVTASSLHALLVDHGWRFGENAAGAVEWTRVRPGEADPATGRVYDGPRRYPMVSGDRIVVDEAGMVDLHTASALATLAEETGAGIALVGDHLQAMPVGHSGAMAMMTRRSGTVVELTAVHRFVDPEYAALSLRVRDPGSSAKATEVAELLHERGHVALVDSAEHARDRMVDAWFDWAGRGKRAALVTMTNAEAQNINDRIQQRLVDEGRLSLSRIGVGQDEQRILVGDVVQTRRNNTELDVDNRALWRVVDITRDGAVLASLSDSADTRAVTADYLAEHVHLAYASTVHGIQGETMDASIVGPGVDAAGLYVGMTRGRRHNEVVVVARSLREAVAEVASTMLRGTPEVTVDDGIRAAREELARAARTPVAAVDAASASWDDRGVRPLGAIVDLDAYLEQVSAKVPALRSELEELGDLIRRDQTALRELESRQRTLEARGHAAAATVDGDVPVPSGPLVTVRARLVARLEEREQVRKTKGGEYASAVRALEHGPLERDVRAGQSEAQRDAEHRARLSHIRSRRARGAAVAPGPAVSTPLYDGPALGL
ncbi:AAA family ATPase [Microbacterium sp. SLBN-111]|uniref:AAA family ATPase n=1 Tax=Microbacterium sp. SLBN-111 TaxID=3377733 RepID=UPI003C73CF24